MKKNIIWVPMFNFYPHSGGAEKQAEKLYEELIKQGKAEVTVITARLDKNWQKQEFYKNINIIRLPFIYKGQNVLLKKISSFVFLLELFTYLLLNHKKYDIIQNFHIDKYTAISILCALLVNKPAVIREANESKSVKGKENIEKSLIQRILYKIYRKASAYIAITDVIKDEFINLYKFTPEKIYHIPNGVNLPEKNDKIEARKNNDISNDTLVAIIVGRLENQKNHIKLFNAWKYVIKKNPKALLLCLGDGSERENYENYIKSNNCQENIIITGIINNMPDYYQAADLFVLPSFYEGMSNALIEAMSFGLPCIVSDIKSNRFLIENNQNGILFDLQISNEQLAEIILDLINNSNFQQKLGNNAKIKSTEFSIKLIAEKYYDLYKKIILSSK